MGRVTQNIPKSHNAFAFGSTITIYYRKGKNASEDVGKFCEVCWDDYYHNEMVCMLLIG